MKKEEFPTFLNEQPTVIFGRTGRELLIIACGLVSSYTTVVKVNTFIAGSIGLVLGITLAIMIVVLAFAIALISIGNRSIEEWAFCGLLYILTPKLYIYKSVEENPESGEDEKSKNEHQQDDADDIADAFEED
jgi:Ca2+/Na+ antiporter